MGLTPAERVRFTGRTNRFTGRTNQNAEIEPHSPIWRLFKGLSKLLEPIFRGSKWLLRGVLGGNSRAVRRPEDSHKLEAWRLLFLREPRTYPILPVNL